MYVGKVSAENNKWKELMYTSGPGLRLANWQVKKSNFEKLRYRLQSTSFMLYIIDILSKVLGTICLSWNHHLKKHFLGDNKSWYKSDMIKSSFWRIYQFDSNETWPIIMNWGLKHYHGVSLELLGGSLNQVDQPQVKKWKIMTKSEIMLNLASWFKRYCRICMY